AARRSWRALAQWLRATARPARASAVAHSARAAPSRRSLPARADRYRWSIRSSAQSSSYHKFLPQIGSKAALWQGRLCRAAAQGPTSATARAAQKRPREDTMQHPLKTVLVAAAFTLPLAAFAQERYPTLNADQLSPEQKAYIESLQKPPRNNTGALRNPPFKVYMRSPALASKLEAVSDYVRWGTGQPPRLTELAIMITARQWSSQWIWRGHYRAAVKDGLDPSVGADIAAGRRPTKMKEDETILYNYATEMYRDKAVSDATFAAAVKALGEKGLIDLVATMGYYDTVAMTLITAKAVAPKEEDVPQLAELAK